MNNLIKIGVILPALVGSLNTNAKNREIPTTNKPNVLVIYTDDHRYTGIHALGKQQVKTPHIDELVHQGISFSNAYLMGAFSGATCMPSRAMLLTGRQLFGLKERGHLIPKEHTTMGEVFQQAGYQTIIVGKWHSDFASLSRSFDGGEKLMGLGAYLVDHYRMPYWDWNKEGIYKKEDAYLLQYGDEGKVVRRPLAKTDMEGPTGTQHTGPHTSEVFADHAIQYIRQQKKKKPYFMYLAFHAPHDPRQAPQKYRAMYPPDQIELPPSYLPQHPFDNGSMVIRDEKLAPWPRTPEIARQQLADYYAIITHLDAQIGRVIEALKESGQYDNTIIILAGDSGLGVGCHGLLGKQNIYDEDGIHVPFIVSGNLVAHKGSVIDAFCYIHDIFPTVCDLAGIPIPETVSGKSLVPVIKGVKKQVRDDTYHAYMQFQRAYRKGDYKLIEYVKARDVSKESGEVTIGSQVTQLFNFKKDPWETLNLAVFPENWELLKSMQEGMRKAAIELGDTKENAGIDVDFWDYYEGMERLRVSRTNSHLLETISGKPVFLNNFTAWDLIGRLTREEVVDCISICKSKKFNMISAVILEDKTSNSNNTIYDTQGFENDAFGNPDPLQPIVTPGNDPKIPGQYDFWDHVDYVVNMTAANGMYISLHPNWGDWVSGHYRGQLPNDKVIFNETNAYQYGQWLGQRYGEKPNVIWMLGGDRSAVYDSKTRWARLDIIQDFRAIYSAMAEGLADGTNGENNQNGVADYSNTIISFHSRKWAPNSSEWFHNDRWLTINSIQDMPDDQVKSIIQDYNLLPAKPTWLFEGRYEGNISAWGVRYQAYQTSFAGGSGHTYGAKELYLFGNDWRKLMFSPGIDQMKHLYTVVREIWTDQQFSARMPDQGLIVGDQGATIGDSDLRTTNKEGDIILERVKDVGSDRITAIRDIEGKWAMAYSANGREITIDLSRLLKGTLNAYWFNPRNEKWHIDQVEVNQPTPFISKLATGKGAYTFDPPGEPGNDNDWVLVLK